MGQNDLYRDKIEVSLDGRQIFSLFFAGAIIICTVFVIGVMVGKRVEARAHVDRAAPTQADPLAALDRLESESPLTFRRALRHGEAAAGSVDAEIAALASAQRAAEVATKPAEAKEAAAPAKPTPKAEASAKADKAAVEEDGKADKAAKAKADKGAASEKLEASKPPKDDKDDEQAKADKVSASDEPAKEERKAKKSKYTLQLSSFQERSEADAFLVELRAAGYAPTIVPAEVEGKGTFYRVRLGSYPTYEAAVEAKAEFERKISRIAYVTKI